MGEVKVLQKISLIIATVYSQAMTCFWSPHMNGSYRDYSICLNRAHGQKDKSNQMEVNCQLTSRFLGLFALAMENKGNWHSVDDRQTQMFKLMRRY